MDDSQSVEPIIEFIQGTLQEAHPTFVVVENGGFGWRLPITLSAFERLPAPGEPVSLSTHLAVREDSLMLYGFADSAERDLFELLIQVNGIGPKLAMTALSGLPGPTLLRAIADGDVKCLSGISGIGRKMAERLVVELKDKIDPGVPPSSAAAEESQESKTIRDATLALVALGYKQQDARAMLKRLPPDIASASSVEELVRRSLRSP